MDAGVLTGLLGLGFGLGLVHALDADHVMAVSTLASLRARPRDAVRYALRWAMGHGAVLLVLGWLAFALGIAIPASWSRWAELAVGIVLMALGAYVLRDLLRQRAHLHFHTHDGLPAHAHWHEHAGEVDSKDADHSQAVAHGHHHGALFIGALHGLAGSAPLLALIPAVAQGSPYFGLAYLLAFCAGVLLAMALFGGIFGSLISGFLHKQIMGAVHWVRGVTALGSLLLGASLAAASF